MAKSRKASEKTAEETAKGIVANSGNCPEGQTQVATANGMECVDHKAADKPRNLTGVEQDLPEVPEEDEEIIAQAQDESPEEEEEVEEFSLDDAKILKEKLDTLFPAKEDVDIDVDEEPEEEEIATADIDDPEEEEIYQEAKRLAERSSGDARSSRKATREYLKAKKLGEAKKELQLREAQIKAQELYVKKLELQNRIKSAKESAVPKFNVPDTKNVDKAYESQVANPAKWFESVSQGENVMPSSVWNINKEKIYENYGQRFTRNWDKDFIERFEPVSQTQKTSGTEAIAGPPANDFMRTMSEQVLVLPNGKIVTPVRQFCEVKILPPGVKEAFFYDYGAVDFAAITEGSTISDSSVAVRSAGGATSPRGARVQINYSDIEESPIDLVAANNRAFALESINDESKQVLNVAFNNDTGNAGDGTNRKAVGGGAKTGKWVRGNDGSALTADAGVTASHTLSFSGILAAKRKIREQGLDTTNLVLYTSPKGIEDLIKDPNLDSYLSFSKPEAITEGVVERIAGCNIVTSSALADLASGGVAGGKRSVLFIPGVAFGLVSGRDLTMEAQRRNEIQAIHLTGTQKIAGFVKNVEATCRISHA